MLYVYEQAWFEMYWNVAFIAWKLSESTFEGRFCLPSIRVKRKGTRTTQYTIVAYRNSKPGLLVCSLTFISVTVCEIRSYYKKHWRLTRGSLKFSLGYFKLVFFPCEHFFKGREIHK